MKQLSFLLLCTVMSAAAMGNINSTQLADGARNTLSTQSTPYNLSNNWEQDEVYLRQSANEYFSSNNWGQDGEDIWQAANDSIFRDIGEQDEANVSFPEGESDSASKKRKHQNLNNVSNDNETASQKRIRLDTNAKRKPSAITVALKSILKDSPIEACKESLANATRYFLYIQCIGQNILYHLLKDNKDVISLLSQSGLSEDQLRGIYEIVKLSDTKTGDEKTWQNLSKALDKTLKLEDGKDSILAIDSGFSKSEVYACIRAKNPYSFLVIKRQNSLVMPLCGPTGFLHRHINSPFQQACTL